MSSNNLLQNVYLFKGLSMEQLEMVNDISHLENYGAGDEVFTQGDMAHSLYVIKYGSVKISQKTSEGDTLQVASLGTGSHFGEMAFLDGEQRSASAMAIEKSEIVAIDYEKLRSLLVQDSSIAVEVYKELAHFLCGRLRVTTNDLSFAREKNLSHF